MFSIINELKVETDYLPISHNRYLAPRTQRVGRKVFATMYETKEAKDWKKLFKGALLRAINEQDFDVAETKNGYWYLDCEFTLRRRNQDCANFFKILLDSMTGIAYIDDKNIMPRVFHVSVDSKHPHMSCVLKRAY